MQLTYHQKEKPNSLTQRNGVTLQEGLPIAYNRSGEVILGTIVEVIKNDWKPVRKGIDDKFWWKHDFQMKVISDNGIPSTIRNFNSFVVI